MGLDMTSVDHGTERWIAAENVKRLEQKLCEPLNEEVRKTLQDLLTQERERLRKFGD